MPMHQHHQRISLVGKFGYSQFFGASDAPLVKGPTNNVEAYNLVLRGRYYTVRATAPETEKSLECFTQALALEPDYAQAHAGIAINHAVRAIASHGRPSQLMPTAEEASRKALAIDNTVVDAHTALAFVLQFYEWDWPGAEREYRRALDLNPADTFARTHYSLLLGQTGKADASITEARHAVVSDPLSVHSRHMLAMSLVMARRFDQAMVETRAGLELDAYQPLYWDLCWALVGLGRLDEAVERGREATTLAPGDLMAQSWLGWTLGLAGKRREATTILEDLERRRRQEYVGGVVLASVCVGLDAHEQAISWLQQAAEERDGFMPWLNTLLVFDPLRSAPRFPSPPPPPELPRAGGQRLALPGANGAPSAASSEGHLRPPPPPPSLGGGDGGVAGGWRRRRDNRPSGLPVPPVRPLRTVCPSWRAGFAGRWARSVCPGCRVRRSGTMCHASTPF